MVHDIILSVYIPTYNHEKYIAQALEGVLKQKTKYKFEVLVGEDCSTDNTRAIVKEYEEKYPGRFQIFYREHNMYGKTPNNSVDLRQRCKGKYIMCLEGDDFWIDECKIEKQIDFLENNPEYLGVAHNCIVVDEESKPNGEMYPECKEEEYTLKHFVSEIMPGQYATLMYRNYYIDEYMDTSILKKGLRPGDRVTYFALTLNGRIRCIQEPMTAYRHVKKSGTSFSATYKYSFENAENWNYSLVQYARNFDKNVIKYTEMIYFRNLMIGLKERQCTKKQIFKYMKKINYKFSVVGLYIKHWIRHHLLHKKLWV